MRLLKFALVGLCLTSAGCYTTGGDRYAMECTITRNPDGTVWEECDQNTKTQIFTICVHDKDGPFEVEGNEEDLITILSENEKNHEGHCTEIDDKL